MSAFTTLLGRKLQGNNGALVDTVDVLKNKTAVGVYFSAHWCPPCRKFTPQLAQLYLRTLKAKGLEIVFVSSDKNETAFQEYHAQMPWLAVPYSDRNRQRELNDCLKVDGIPTLVILDGATARIITTEGRDKVIDDIGNFPWIPMPKVNRVMNVNTPSVFDKLLGPKLQGKTGALVSTASVLKNKTAVGIYFSGHWCPPCRRFTPQLAELYTKVLKAKGLEIVFVSSDKSAEQFGEYYAEMPWLALPYADRKGKKALTERFGVSGIPKLVILDGVNGEIITADGKTKVLNDYKNFPWMQLCGTRA